jgi:hypothetical protein
MQVACPNQHAPQNPVTRRMISTNRPSQMQVAQLGNPCSQPPRSVHSDSPSRMQVVVVQEQLMVPRRSDRVLNAMMQPPTEYTSGLRHPPYISSIRGLPTSSPYNMPSQQHHPAPATQLPPSSRQAPTTQMPPTFAADRPQEGRTNIIVPGEPHHFGMRTNYSRGEIISTLCRCATPRHPRRHIHYAQLPSRPGHP